MNQRVLRSDRRAALAVVSVLVLCGMSSSCTSGTPSGPGVATSSDGTVIAYSVRGNGPTTLLFVHGWACDQTYWSAQVGELAEEYTVVTLDLAGHGLSGDSRQDWSIARFAEDVVAVVEALELTDVVLIGHSLGGPIVLEAALAAPDRVVAVVGADTFMDVFASGPFEPLLTSMREDFRAATEPFVRGMFLDSSPSDLVERIVADMASQSPSPGVAALEAIQSWGPRRMEAALRELNVPLGVIQTSKSRQASGLVDAKLSNGLERRNIELDGLGHFLMAEDPARFNDALVALVRDLTGSD